MPGFAAAMERLFGSKVEKLKYSASALAVGMAEYWATSLSGVSEEQWMGFAKSAWRIEMYHRALKQQCLI